MIVTTDSMVLFWRPDAYLSNWYPCNFEYLERRFQNSEAAMMWEKARLFDDVKISEQILTDQNPHRCKERGRQVKNFDPAVWDIYKEQFVTAICLEKFRQNADLSQLLLDTGSRILVEASPVDRIWGIGLAPDDPLALDQHNWRGQNLLGQILMQVRKRLRF